MNISYLLCLGASATLAPFLLPKARLWYDDLMESEIAQKLQEQDEKLERIYVSVEKTRKYLKWTFIATIVFFVLPLVIIMMILPSLISGITASYSI